ncbi:MAG: hypothetical protein HZB20_03020 [Chloroflexi bacterium]|nr:hypothetical protein [Chloroflexota bacterium]
MLEWIDVVVAVALALMLRFGIPLLITTVLVWALRRRPAPCMAASICRAGNSGGKPPAACPPPVWIA